MNLFYLHQHGQGYFAERRVQNAERRMVVSGIECETGRYIIHDKLKRS